MEISYDEFDAAHIREKADHIIADSTYAKQAAMLGRRLLQLGGCDNIVRECR